MLFWSQLENANDIISFVTLKVLLKVKLHLHTICIKKIIKNMISSILLKIWCIQEPIAKSHLKFGNLLKLLF